MHACQSEAQPEEGLGPREAEYLANADSFYMATASETGWPYVQHRGGPRGFLKVISPTQLAFADFLGNRQYVSVGNAAGDARVSIIVVDYASQRRLKLLGRLRFEEVGEADPEFVFAVELPDDPARVERVAAIEVEAVGWNCPQHITARFTLEEIDAASKPLHERIAQLEAEVVALRMQLAPQTWLSRWEESFMENSATLAAVHTGSRAGEDARRRRCLEHPRSGARFARLHAGQHVAQPRRVPCWPRGRRADDHPGLSDLGL